MDYQEKLDRCRKDIKEKKALQIIDGLEILFEWIEFLYKSKRIKKEQEKELLPYYPSEILAECKKAAAAAAAAAHHTTLKEQDFKKLTQLFLREASELINTLINLGNLKLTDFDLLQFNLSQVFGKEEITTMLEWARLHLVQVAKEKGEEGLRQRRERKKAEEEYLQKIRAMPQSELNKLAVSQLFDFSSRARTPRERVEAIKKNKERVVGQRVRFKHFEEKLIEATTEARAEAQSNVYRQIGKVQREMDQVISEFKEKAKEFASEEGPRRMIRKSKKMILNQKEKLEQELKDKGRDWKKHFRAETEKAGGDILEKQRELDIEIAAKGRNWKDTFRKKWEKARLEVMDKRTGLAEEQEETGRFIAQRGKSEIAGAKSRITKGKTEFGEDIETAKKKFSGRAEEMREKGERKIDQARTMMLKEKAEFQEDVEGARKEFSEKAEEIGAAQADFIIKRNKAQENFLQRGAEVETELYGTIYEGKKKFERAGEDAKARFGQKAEEIKGGAQSYVYGKKEQFIEERSGAQQKFRGKAEEIKGQGISGGRKFGVKSKEFKVTGFKGKEKFTAGSQQLAARAGIAKSRLEQEHQTMKEKSGQERQKMQEEMKRKKELFLYDVRFAQHNIQERAKQFAEKIAAKQEEFGTKGGQVVARHRVRQKASLMRNLLRTIRSMG